MKDAASNTDEMKIVEMDADTNAETQIAAKAEEQPQQVQLKEVVEEESAAELCLDCIPAISELLDLKYYGEENHISFEHA